MGSFFGSVVFSFELSFSRSQKISCCKAVMDEIVDARSQIIKKMMMRKNRNSMLSCENER